MRNDLVALAARNNALWCDAVCRVNGKAGEFRNDVWLNRYGTPRFYPDAITIADSGTDPDIIEVLTDLFDSSPGRGWAVKDSFSRIDLGKSGFEPLFDAQWLRLEETSETHLVRTSSASLVRSEAELRVWGRAWSGVDAEPDSCPFKPALLADPDIVFVSLERDGAIRAGGILNRGAKVVGISNVFADAAFTDAIWQELTAAAAGAFPGLPVVSYEHGQELETACRNGFEPIGPLRIWHRTGLI